MRMYNALSVSVQCPVTANPTQCERDLGHPGAHGIMIDGNWCVWTNPVMTDWLASKFSDIAYGLMGPVTVEELA